MDGLERIVNQTAARYEAEAADPERLRQQRDGLWDLARVNAAEIARLKAEVKRLETAHHRLPTDAEVARLRGYMRCYAPPGVPDEWPGPHLVRCVIVDWEMIRCGMVDVEGRDGQDRD